MNADVKDTSISIFMGVFRSGLTWRQIYAYRWMLRGVLYRAVQHPCNGNGTSMSCVLTDNAASRSVSCLGSTRQMLIPMCAAACCSVCWWRHTRAVMLMWAVATEQSSGLRTQRHKNQTQTGLLYQQTVDLVRGQQNQIWEQNFCFNNYSTVC